MKERSIFSYWWFWLLIIGTLLILLAALFHLGFKDNTQWVWWIFAGGVLLAVIGIIFAFISYYTEPKCTPVKTGECPKIVPSSLPQSDCPYAVHSPIPTPSVATTNFPQAQRGFTATNLELSSLAPSK